MIKFNFHIKTTTASHHTNADNPDDGTFYSGKNSWKIILIVFGAFFFICIIALTGFFSIALSGINSILKSQNEKREQWNKIYSLPLLKCKIHNLGTVAAPLSGTPAAFYLLRVGTEQYVSYESPGTSGRSYTNKELEENFDYNMIAGYPKGTKISINGRLYTVSFQKAIMDTLGNGEMHFTKKIISRNPIKYSNSISFSHADYKIIRRLKNSHPWISSYVENPYKESFKNIIIKEYVFNNGDSLYIKGKISGNKILVYNEHKFYMPVFTQKEIQENMNR